MAQGERLGHESAELGVEAAEISPGKSLTSNKRWGVHSGEDKWLRQLLCGMKERSVYSDMTFKKIYFYFLIC